MTTTCRTLASRLAALIAALTLGACEAPQAGPEHFDAGHAALKALPYTATFFGEPWEATEIPDFLNHGPLTGNCVEFTISGTRARGHARVFIGDPSNPVGTVITFTSPSLDDPSVWHRELDGTWVARPHP
jgi:hypothetical protein